MMEYKSFFSISNTPDQTINKVAETMQSEGWDVFSISATPVGAAWNLSIIFRRKKQEPQEDIVF